MALRKKFEFGKVIYNANFIVVCIVNEGVGKERNVVVIECVTARKSLEFGPISVTV